MDPWRKLLLQELARKDEANLSSICFMLWLRVVRGERFIVVEKRATSRENALRVLRVVRPLVGVRKPAMIVGRKATSRKNTLKVLKAVRPMVGVGEELIQEVREKLRIVHVWKLH